MNHITNDEAKSYSNIYFSEKDAEVEMMVGAAEGYLAKFLNRSSLSDSDLLVDPDQSPPPDSPGVEALLPEIKLCVLMVFDEFWQNHGINVVGSTVTENPTWLRVAHLYRVGLGV